MPAAARRASREAGPPVEAQPPLPFSAELPTLEPDEDDDEPPEADPELDPDPDCDPDPELEPDWPELPAALEVELAPRFVDPELDPPETLDPLPELDELPLLLPVRFKRQ